MGIDLQKGQILWDFISQCEVWHVWVNLITFRNTDVSEEVDEEDIQSTEGIKVYKLAQ